MRRKIVSLMIIFLFYQSPIFAQEFSINKTGLKNPFKSALPKRPEVVKIESVPGATKRLTQPIEPDIKPPQLLISGLIWNSDRPQAIVNDQVVGIGDTINEFQIIKINQAGIEIQYSGKNFVIERSSSLTNVKNKFN